MERLAGRRLVEVLELQQGDVSLEEFGVVLPEATPPPPPFLGSQWSFP